MDHPCITALDICLENRFQDSAIAILKDFLGFRKRLLAVNDGGFSSNDVFEHEQDLADVREELKKAIRLCVSKFENTSSPMRDHKTLAMSTDEIEEMLVNSNESELDDHLMLLTATAWI